MNVDPWLGFSEPFSSLSHLMAAFAFFAGAFFLVRKGQGNASRITSLIIYTFSLVFLYSMSGVYHLLEFGSLSREVLQRLDHAGIWILIAGSFTPVHVILFRGAWRWAILLVVWAVAILGLVLEVIFFHEFPEWLTLTLFLSLGWMGALTGYKFRTSFHGESLKLLILGGVSYSVGAVIDFSRIPPLIPGVIGAHEIFHIFVVLGSLFHWMFIYQWASHPVANTIAFHIVIFPNNQFKAYAVGDHMEIAASSLAELKTKIKTQVLNKYHESIIPEIHLKYFHEEVLTLGADTAHEPAPN